MSTAISTPERISLFYTPSGHYFASAADAAFWTRVEREREARELECRRQYEAQQAERVA